MVIFTGVKIAAFLITLNYIKFRSNPRAQFLTYLIPPRAASIFSSGVPRGKIPRSKNPQSIKYLRNQSQYHPWAKHADQFILIMWALIMLFTRAWLYSRWLVYSSYFAQFRLSADLCFAPLKEPPRQPYGVRCNPYKKSPGRVIWHKAPPLYGRPGSWGYYLYLKDSRTPNQST